MTFRDRLVGGTVLGPQPLPEFPQRNRYQQRAGRTLRTAPLRCTPTAVLALRGRVAWAHDWVSDPTLAACMNRGNRIANEPHIILAISAHRITHPTPVSRGFPLLMSNHRLASFARRDGPDTRRQGESRPVPKAAGSTAPKAGTL